MTSTHHLRRTFAFAALSIGVLGSTCTVGDASAQDPGKPKKLPLVVSTEDLGKPIVVPTVKMEKQGGVVPKVPQAKPDPTFAALRKAEKEEFQKVKITPVPTEELQAELARRYSAAETAAAEIQKSITIPPPASAGAGGSIEIKPFEIPPTLDPAAFPTVDPAMIDPKRGVAKPLGGDQKKIKPSKPDSTAD